MGKNRKISSLEFDFLLSMEPVLPKTDESGYKALKISMLDAIESAFGDKWFYLSKKTKQAIDYICFLSLERGFVYASPDHIAEKHNLSKSTVYEAIKTLRETGIIYKANRCSKKQNGLGCSVLFFTIHPKFEYISRYLKLEWKAEQNADQKAENCEMPTETSEVGEFRSATYNLPTHHLDEHKVIQSNVTTTESAKPKLKFVKYVPKEINEVYADLFGFRLRFIWQKISQAWKQVNHDALNRDDLITIGANVIKRIWQHWKKRMHHGENMDIDEMCAYAYKTAKESFYNTLAEIYMEDYQTERSLSNSMKNSIAVPNSERRIALVNSINREKQKKEAICNIPELEYMAVCNGLTGFNEIRRAVIEAIIEKYDLLEYEDIEDIDRNYNRYTTQFHFLSQSYRKTSRVGLCFSF